MTPASLFPLLSGMKSVGERNYLADIDGVEDNCFVWAGGGSINLMSFCYTSMYIQCHDVK